jgi:hypothetical protein
MVTLDAKAAELAAGLHLQVAEAFGIHVARMRIEPGEWVSLPSGTLKVKGEAVCASLNRLPIEPCFNLNRIDDQSFRGSISGLDFAHCDFSRRVRVTDRRPRLAILANR